MLGVQVGDDGGFSPGKLRSMLLGVEKKRKEQEDSKSTFNLRSQASVFKGNVCYMARLENGTVFEKRGVDGMQLLEFITDNEQVIAGFDLVVATMKKGEQAMLTIHPEFGFGSVELRRDLAIVPPSSIIVFEVEMVDFVKVLAINVAKDFTDYWWLKEKICKCTYKEWTVVARRTEGN